MPRGEDLDLDFCARAFEFSGGAIRSVVVTAAYLAADKVGPVGMAELITAVQREYRKLGRLLLERDSARTTSSSADRSGRKPCPEVRAVGPCQGPAPGGTVRSMRAHD